jgi:hypothetical protein
MKSTTILLAALALAALQGCSNPIPPRFSESPPQPKPERSANQPSTVETTSSEYEGNSSSTGSSTR